jgi:hypothetical protein
MAPSGMAPELYGMHVRVWNANPNTEGVMELVAAGRSSLSNY